MSGSWNTQLSSEWLEYTHQHYHCKESWPGIIVAYDFLFPIWVWASAQIARVYVTPAGFTMGEKIRTKYKWQLFILIDFNSVEQP